ncbi:hypothetical protein MASR2M15_25970 [Anaerolineales bacterium]
MTPANVRPNQPVDNYVAAAMAAFDAGQYPKAIKFFDKAIRLSIGNMAEIYVYRGECCAYLERWEEALQDFGKALQHDAFMVEAYNERGNVRRFMGDYQGAIEDQTIALRIDPQFMEAYYNRALAYQALQQWTPAEADLSQVIQLMPGFAPAYQLRAESREQLHQWTDAIHDYERYLRMGGGREYDNHVEIQQHLWRLKMKRFFLRFIGR